MHNEDEELNKGESTGDAGQEPDKAESTGGDGASYLYPQDIERLIEEGNLEAAQRLLDGENERNAQWHFFQSKLFLKKNWVYESRKQMEIAVKLDPENQAYKDELEKLNAMGDVPPQKEATYTAEELSGPKKHKCLECMGEGCGELCCAGGAECCCSIICEGIANGC